MNRSLTSLKSYLDTSPESPRWEPTPGVVVVGSGKGGVGTSTVSVLLALAAAREGRSVLLVDGDEGVGSLRFLVGSPGAGPGLGAMRGGRVMPSDLLEQVEDSLWFLPGGGGDRDATLALSLGERRALFRRVAGLYDRFDLVVLDGGSYLASVMGACGAGAERLLALTAADRVSMAATYALLKVGIERFPALPVEVLVNGAEPAVGEEVYRTILEAGDRFLGLTPRYGGSIPRDPALQDMLHQGLPLSTLDSTSPSAKAISDVQGRLAGEQAAAVEGGASVLGLPRGSSFGAKRKTS